MAVKTPSPLIAQARKQWVKASDAETEQRKAILAAKKFRALDQWPTALKNQREGAPVAGQPPQPPRPCLVVDRINPSVRTVSNTIKNADFGFDVMPNGMGADTETADILKGYLRRVQNQSRGESPIEWAADGAIEGGIGWFRIKTRFVHESWDGDPADPEAYDQELVLKRIPNNLSVYDDPAANEPTRRDALFRFIVEDLDRDAFEDRFPDADLRGLEEFQSTGDMSAWVSKDTIRVAEYWRVSFEKRHIWMSDDGRGGEGTPPKGVKVAFERHIRKPIVKGSLINAVQELEPFEWVGSRIPTIPILGEELNIDGKFKLRGIIEPAMDPQRMVNYTYSGAVEIYSLAGKKSPLVVASAVANYKSVWDTRNVYNYSYMPYDAWDTEGRPLPAPIFDQTEAPIQAAVALMQVSEEAIKASTSTGDATLGNSNPNERSGKALNALQAQSDLANSNYPDNVKRALIYAAELMGEVIPKITRPGQILHILGMDDKPEQVMIGKPFKTNAQGVPEEAPPEVTPEIAKLKESLYKFYDPTAGKYSYTVTVNKSSATRREEGAAALGELIPHLPPEMAAVVMPDYVKQLSFPGAQGIAERLEDALPEQLKPKKEGEEPQVPPEVQKQLQEMQTQLQQAAEMIKTDQVKTGSAEKIAQGKEQGAAQAAQLKEQGEMQRAQLEQSTRLEIARMDNATKLQIEEFKLRGQQMQAELDAREAQLGAQQQAEAAGADRAHEAGMAAMGQQAAGAQQQAAQGHEAAQAEAQRQAATEAQGAEQQHAAEMQDAQQRAAQEQAAAAAQQQGGGQ